MREIIKRPLVQTDLIVIAAYLENEADARVAERFLNAVEGAFDKLAVMPGMGVKRTYGAVELQMWPVPKFTNYLIFYTVTDSSLEIVRILHGARDIASLFDPKDETALDNEDL